MAATVDASSFQLSWLSLPFVLAAAGIIGMALYVLFINGSRVLRASFLMFVGGLVPVVTSVAVAAVIRDDAFIAAVYRIGFALIPIAAAGILVFECAMARQLFGYRWFLVVIVSLSFALAIPALATDWYVAGLQHTEWGLSYFSAGPLVPVQLGLAILWLGMTAALLEKQRRAKPDPLRKRQLKFSFGALAALAAGMGDGLLAYGIGVYPISWLFFPLSALLLLRSLQADSLIDTQSVDRRAGFLLVYAAAAAVGTWLVWDLLGGQSATYLVILTLGLFAILRVLITLTRLTRNPSSSDASTPLERLLEQYSSQLQGLHEGREIGAVTSDTLRLGLGCELSGLLLPSAKDYSWETSSGETISEEAQPDPFTFNWLLEHPEPIQRSELPGMRLGDLRPSVEALFAANVADVIVPLVSRDDMVGMLVLGFRRTSHPLSREELDFLGKITEQLAATLIYARMHAEVNRRVAAQKEVELAAAVQRAFVPGGDFVDCGSVQLSGLWAPATQCGGDWWSVHQLPDGRVLVLIGDVTGHGVAAAMITAAAKGCYDIAERLMGNDFDLVRLLDLLDSSVRLMGAERLHMTCFATLLDPDGGKVEFANAGHSVPYICRPLDDGGIDLGALVARGNPLGSQGESPHRARSRDLAPGDILVWYTDGIVECTDPERKQFGDRRLQRLLRKIDRLEPNPRAVRDHIVRAVVAFQKDQAPDDDITLVVARVARANTTPDQP